MPMELQRMRAWISAALVLAQGAYFLGLFGWAVLYFVLADRWFWLFALNSFSAYLFLPLFVLPLLAVVTRQRWLGVAWVAGVALGAYLYADLWLPRAPTALAGHPPLTVMTYNTLGPNEDTAATLATIRASGADLVLVQELNPPTAAALGRELAAEYPYQVLDARDGVEGMGAISRYPLRATGEALPLRWIGQPQVLALDFAGRAVAVLNVHTLSGAYVREREAQARAITAFVDAHPGPLVVGGDFNATDHSTTYRLVTERLRDAWRGAGQGLGATWPGAEPGGGGPLTVAGLPVPRWLIRIDYVFHSPHWTTAAARLGSWDGNSDHRPVIAELALAE
jgi:vancomycin resistance protein VanJ